jgi:GntR family transcriptional regulator
MLADRVVGGAMPTSKRDAEQDGASDRKLRYQRVYDLVLELVAEQGLNPGDRLPTTAELADIAGVSSISVRRALDELERAGKIRRRQGLGTFVADPRIAADPTRPGELLQTLIDSDRKGAPATLTTSLISIGVGLPSSTILTALGVEPGQPVWEIWRKRSLGSDDSILERAVLPLSRVPAIDQERLAAGESLYRFIQERYSITDDYTEQAFEVDTPNNWEAKHLRIAPTDPIVRVRGVSFDTEGRAFDCFEQCYRATKFTFYTAGQTRHRILGPAEMANWSVTALTGQDG